VTAPSLLDTGRIIREAGMKLASSRKGAFAGASASLHENSAIFPA
jgi:hypothetical protein